MQKSNSHAAAHESWRQGCWVQLQQNEKPSNLPNQALLAQPAPMRPPSHLCHATRINTGSSLFQTILVLLLRLLRNFCAFCVRLVFFCVVAPYSSNTALIYSSCKSANPKSHHSRLRGNDGFLNLLLLGEPISVFFISVFLASAAACWHWLAQAAGTSCGL